MAHENLLLNNGHGRVSELAANARSGFRKRRIGTDPETDEREYNQ
jgi:hypothetical protein